MLVIIICDGYYFIVSLYEWMAIERLAVQLKRDLNQSLRCSCFILLLYCIIVDVIPSFFWRKRKANAVLSFAGTDLIG